MRTKEWEIGGKRTKSRGRIGRRSIKARTKESATATTTRSQAQHRLITLLHTSDLSLMKSIAKNRQSKPFDSELETCRGNKKKKIQLYYTLNMKERLLFLFCLRERIYIQRDRERGFGCSLSSAGEQRREENERKRGRCGEENKPFQGCVCVREFFECVAVFLFY